MESICELLSASIILLTCFYSMFLLAALENTNIKFTMFPFIIYSIGYIVISIIDLICLVRFGSTLTTKILLLIIVTYLGVFIASLFLDLIRKSELTEDPQDTTLLRSTGVAEYDPASKI